MESRIELGEADIEQLLRECDDGQLVRQPWLCDPMDICVEVIARHNADGLARDVPVEPKFANIPGQAKRLADLLWKDFQFLSDTVPELAASHHRYFFVELASANPNALAYDLESDDGLLHIIGFKSPLIYLLNAVFSKIFVVCHPEREADCLPSDAHHFEGDTYSDTHLLAGILNDLEVLYEHGRLFLPYEPPHVATPFDYCEQVEGARRFLLAHELAHTLESRRGISAELEELIPKSVMSDSYPTWNEEFRCDAFAIKALMDRYRNSSIEHATLFELENSLVGVLTFFTVLDIVDAFLGRHLQLAATHPPPQARRELVRQVIKSHPVYSASEQLRFILLHKWRRINSFRWFLAGVNAPIHFQVNSLWSYPDFLQLLSPIGKRAYRTLFDAMSEEFIRCYDGDFDLFRKYNHYF